VDRDILRTAAVAAGNSKGSQPVRSTRQA